MKALTNELRTEAITHILPFWMNLKDEENGGYYGFVDYSLTVDNQAAKGGIATARQLWTFSSAYRILQDERYLEHAHHAYKFLVEKVIDSEYPGLFWLVTYDGQPLDTRKHVYAQSFGIYALSEYYRVTGNQEALEHAKRLYQLIETNGFDKNVNAYKEEFTRQWVEQPNEMLSENGVVAEITHNTHLHILEAYTNLYRVWKNEELKSRIVNLVELFYTKIFDHDTKFLGVFFNKKWESLIDLKSYGHDIEASWLIDDALKVIELKNPAYEQMNNDIAYNIANVALLEDGSLANESEKGKVDLTRVWWVQAEAMVGFYNAYQKTNDDRFLDIVKGLWNYAKDYLLDRRPGGEWYWAVESDGTPMEREIAGPWKAPYHNTRFCLEFIERNENRK